MFILFDEARNAATHDRTVRAEGRVEWRAEGKNRMARLTDILLTKEKLAELKRALTDSNYRTSLFEIYGL